MQDIARIRESKTLKNKYNIITDTTSNLISTHNAKLAAIKEKNSMIRDINTFELKRQQQLKTQLSQEDDATQIAKMYNAFVQTPVNQNGLFGPNIENITMGSSDLPVYPIGSDTQSWEQSLDPAGNRMLMEAKGLIETIVVFNEATGERWYDVIDRSTGVSVPNVEKPDESSIYDLTISTREGYAKDTNRKVVYPLKVINSGMGDMSNY